MTQGSILTINAGSSSIKFAVFAEANSSSRLLSGQVERIGAPDAKLVVTRAGENQKHQQSVHGQTHKDAAREIAEYLKQTLGDDAIGGIGHRVVDGGVELRDHQPVTPDLMETLRKAQPMDTAHLPREIALIEAFGEAFPKIPQIACFDTVFFRDLPTVSQRLPIPRKYTDAGIRRLGFHGLSYTYLMEKLAEVAGPEAARGKVILAHLGAGASMAAIRDGAPIDTSMAFTPNAGLLMATRCGDLDPGLLVYLMRQEKLSADALDHLISSESGLIGISQTSADMRDLLAVRASDARAAEAVDLFCYQAKKFVGAYAAALGGLDTLVFAGGIGEHAWKVRANICEGLDFLGLVLASGANTANAAIISSPQSRVTVRVISTDEESVIARIARGAT
jgi:acetate kinase